MDSQQDTPSSWEQGVPHTPQLQGQASGDHRVPQQSFPRPTRLPPASHWSSIQEMFSSVDSFLRTLRHEALLATSVPPPASTGDQTVPLSVNLPSPDSTSFLEDSQRYPYVSQAGSSPERVPSPVTVSRRFAAIPSASFSFPPSQERSTSPFLIERHPSSSRPPAPRRHTASQTSVSQDSELARTQPTFEFRLPPGAQPIVLRNPSTPRAVLASPLPSTQVDRPSSNSRLSPAVEDKNVPYRLTTPEVYSASRGWLPPVSRHSPPRTVSSPAIGSRPSGRSLQPVTDVTSPLRALPQSAVYSTPPSVSLLPLVVGSTYPSQESSAPANHFQRLLPPLPVVDSVSPAGVRGPSELEEDSDDGFDWFMKMPSSSSPDELSPETAKVTTPIPAASSRMEVASARRQHLPDSLLPTPPKRAFLQETLAEELHPSVAHLVSTPIVQDTPRRPTPEAASPLGRPAPPSVTSYPEGRPSRGELQLTRLRRTLPSAHEGFF